MSILFATIRSLFALAALVLPLTGHAAISDFYGSWDVSFRGADAGTCSIVISGYSATEARISGTCRSSVYGSATSGAGFISATGALSFRGGASDVSFSGSIQGNSGSGTWLNTDGDSGTWSMTRSGSTSTATPGFTLSQGIIPAGNVTVLATGNLSSQTLNVDIKIADIFASTFSADGYNVYVAALVPGELVGQTGGSSRWFVKVPSETWEPMGDPIKAFLSNVAVSSQDQRVRLSILSNTNLLALVGTEIYIGYGTSSSEMIQNRRYRGVFDVQP